MTPMARVTYILIALFLIIGISASLLILSLRNNMLNNFSEIAHGVEVHSYKSGDYSYTGAGPHDEFTLVKDGTVMSTFNGQTVVGAFDNGDFVAIKDRNWDVAYLIRNNKELAHGKKVNSFDNGDYSYADQADVHHLYRNGKEIASGSDVLSFENGDYEYQTGNNFHLVRGAKNIVKDGRLFSYKNGDYTYDDAEGLSHLIRNGKEIVVGNDLISFNNGDYAYSLVDGDSNIVKFVKDGKELTLEGKTIVQVFLNGDYAYYMDKEKDANFITLYLVRDAQVIVSGYNLFSFENGDYAYQDGNGVYHLMRKIK